MEEKQGIRGYAGGIIRIIVFIVLIILIAFFVVRFFQNRRANERAERTVETSQSQKTDDSQQPSDRSEATDGQGDEAATSTGRPDGVDRDESVPSGVADSRRNRSGSAGVSRVPEAGMGEDIALTAILISLATFLYFKNRQYIADIR